jgi:aerobic carbon-monoxide dehydrogenase large subunit
VAVTAFKGRREDDRLLKGEGRFTADWDLSGQLYGHFLRADRAHAEILSLDTSSALKSDGVKAIFTGKDTAHFKTPPPALKAPGRGGALIKVPHREILARGRVRFVGQEVGLVVATSAAAAQDAAERIEVEYRDLPAVAEAHDALADGAPRLHDEIPGNLAFDYVYGDEAATDAAFAHAAHVTRLVVESTRLSGNPMEPKACIAAYDAASDSYDLYASTQGMAIMLPQLAAITGVPVEKLRVHARDVGGGFGVRSPAYPEYSALLHAARTLGRPVKWVASRAETIVSDWHGRGAFLGGELALDRDGRFIGLRVRLTCDMGAYLSHSGPLISTVNPATHFINTYRIAALHGEHRLALTNTTPTTAYRGAGRPHVSYLVERLVDEAARETGIDRIELRRRNLIRKEDFPYKTPVGSTYDSGDPPGQLEKAVELSAWSTFENRRKESLKRGRLRGIGLAMFVEPAGGSSVAQEQAEIRFGESGNGTLYALCGPSGQGHETVYPALVAEVLGMPAERLTLKASDPHGPRLAGGGTVGSRSTMSHGSALTIVAREVIKKGLDLAAKALEVSAVDLHFERGSYRVKGTDLAISFQEIAKRHGSALDSQGAFSPTISFPSGTHVAEVEIDPHTGMVEVVAYVGVDDCGRVVNHTLLEGQLHGGITQGIGQALLEHCVYERSSAQLLTGSFMDYAMPRPGILPPEVRLYDHSVPSPNNPLGVKGAGEAGTVGAIPTVANAVIDALRPLGIHALDFPYSPLRIWQAIDAAHR